MERETRIELATNSLEGCDSTIELLPLSILQSISRYKKNRTPNCTIREKFAWLVMRPNCGLVNVVFGA